MKRAAAFVALLGLTACSDPVPAPAAETNATPKFASVWHYTTGTPQFLFNIHETSLGPAGRLRSAVGETVPLRAVMLSATTLSFTAPRLDAKWSAAKDSKGEWTGTWTKGGQEPQTFALFEGPTPVPGFYDPEFATLPDGRHLHLKCLGTGAPTVVLDYGAGGTTQDWKDVFVAISQTTRACVYDRAGRGYSDPGPLPRDAAAVVRDLDQALMAANIAPPYVLVGHSLGSYHVRLFANTHFDKMAGMVLVDPSGDGQFVRFNAVIPKLQQILDASAREQADLNCVVRLREKPVAPDDPFAKQCESNDPDAIEATNSEVESMPGASTEQLTESRRSYGDMPLVVLTRGDYEAGMPPNFTTEDKAAMKKVWTEMHLEMTALSTAGQHRVIPGAGHYIQRDAPQAVIDAVADVVAKARGRTAQQ